MCVCVCVCVRVYVCVPCMCTRAFGWGGGWGRERMGWDVLSVRGVPYNVGIRPEALPLWWLLPEEAGPWRRISEAQRGEKTAGCQSPCLSLSERNLAHTPYHHWSLFSKWPQLSFIFLQRKSFYSHLKADKTDTENSRVWIVATEWPSWD